MLSEHIWEHWSMNELSDTNWKLSCQQGGKREVSFGNIFVPKGKSFSEKAYEISQLRPQNFYASQKGVEDSPV